MGAEARLKELGIVLPELQKPVANYLPYRLVGNVLYLAGQGPRDGKGVQFTGKLLGMVNAAPDFNDSPKVINGCSDLFVEVFGEAGRHARSAVGNVMLPSQISVEIEGIVAVKA